MVLASAPPVFFLQPLEPRSPMVTLYAFLASGCSSPEHLSQTLCHRRVKTTPCPLAIYNKQTADNFTPNLTSVSFPSQMGCGRRNFLSKHTRYLPTACAVLSDDVNVSSSQFEDFSVINATKITENKELKIRIEVFGAKTRAIFNNVFDNMVAEAQPIPGFKRVKGGKTPNIPRDILLEILGPSKVYKKVIKEVINSTVATYVEKEALKVGKDLRIEQSYEDLEDQFEPDENFLFDAIIQLKESN